VKKQLNHGCALTKAVEIAVHYMYDVVAGYRDGDSTPKDQDDRDGMSPCIQYDQSLSHFASKR